MASGKRLSGSTGIHSRRFNTAAVEVRASGWGILDDSPRQPRRLDDRESRRRSQTNRLERQPASQQIRPQIHQEISEEKES